MYYLVFHESIYNNGGGWVAPFDDLADAIRHFNEESPTLFQNPGLSVIDDTGKEYCRKYITACDDIHTEFLA